MAEASRIVLGGFEIDVELDKTVKYPDHYVDPRGTEIVGAADKNP